jgi:threonine 3-dehydrogenase
MSGAEAAFGQMTDVIAMGGAIAFLGIPPGPMTVDWSKIVFKSLTIKGIYGREMFDTWYAMSQMIATSERFRTAVTQVITHRFPAEQWEEAFETARSGQCGKVVLDWS